MIRRAFLKSIALTAGLLSLCVSAARAQAAPEISVRVMSCNIRVDFLPEDAAAGNDWKSRRELCLEVIRSRKPDVVCAQEVLRGQYGDLLAGLPGFTGSGFEGPEMDGKDDGYHGIGKNPILFRQDRFELVASGTYWLSATPHIPGSIAEGGYRARHANWVRLKDRGTGRQFRVVNVHLDSGPGMAPVREKQISMVMEEAAVYPADFTQILAGDLNSRAAARVHEIIRAAGWTDARLQAPGPPAEESSAHAFGTSDKGSTPIDYIYTRNVRKVDSWEIVKDSKGGRYPSDHYFLSAELKP